MDEGIEQIEIGGGRSYKWTELLSNKIVQLMACIVDTSPYSVHWTEGHGMKGV